MGKLWETLNTEIKLGTVTPLIWSHVHQTALRFYRSPRIRVSLLILLAGAVLFWVPKLQANSNELTKKEQLELEDKARGTLAQIIAGASVGLYFTFRNIRATERNVQTAEDKQLAERFSKATEMMSKQEELFTRIGGMHTLEQLAKSSEEYRQLALEVLSTYVKDRSPFPHRMLPYLNDGVSLFDPEASDSEARSHVVDRLSLSMSEATLLTPTLPIDVLKALGIIRYLRNKDTRGMLSWGETSAIGVLDLSDCDLPKVNFVATNLVHCFLMGVSFRFALFSGSNLSFAHLNGSDFLGADFTETNLEGADFTYASLRFATLTRAFLSSANLLKTHGLTQEQINLTYGDADTKLPDHLEPPEHWSKSWKEQVLILDELVGELEDTPQDSYLPNQLLMLVDHPEPSEFY